MALSDALEQRGGDVDALIAAVEEEQGFGDQGLAEAADAAADDGDPDEAAAAHDDSWAGGGAEAAGPDDGGWDASRQGDDQGSDGFDGAEAEAAAADSGSYAPDTEAAAAVAYDGGGNGFVDGGFGDGAELAAAGEHHGGEQVAQEWDAEGEWATEQSQQQGDQLSPEQHASEQVEPWRDGDDNSGPAQHADQQGAEGDATAAAADGQRAGDGDASAAWAAEAAASGRHGVQDALQGTAQGDSPSWHTQPDQQPRQDAGEWGGEDDWGAAPLTQPAAASSVAPQRQDPAASSRPSRR